MSSSSEKTPPPFQASKWLQIQVLLAKKEMEMLIEELGDFNLYFVGKVCIPGEETVSKEKFLEEYGEYVSQLKSGKIPEATRYRPYFSCSLSCKDDHFYTMQAGEGKQIVCIARPVVQMQFHMLGFSPIEKKFRPMILGKNSIHWGIQFSFPQLFLDPETKKNRKCPNE